MQTDLESPMPSKSSKRKLSKEYKRQKLRRKRAREQSERYIKELNNPPRSMIFRRGVVGEHVRELVRNLRAVMSPFSASKLRETKRNQLRDFIQASGPLGITHFMILTQTPTGVGLRVARLPRGPTLTFRVINYTTMHAIQQAQKVPNSLNGPEFSTSPLVVLNNFGGDADHTKIMAAVFQNMYPGLDITKLKLAHCRRVVLFNYNSDTDTVDFRHYAITAVPVGLTRGIRKVIKGQIPARLAGREDIADWVENPNTLSDSEAELPEDARVTLAQNFGGRGNAAAGTSAIKLKELGPRMTLQLYKIEEGICEGQVVYHRYVTKTEEEAQALAERKEQQRAEKAERKALQEANVLKKQQEVEAKAKEREERRAQRAAQATAVAGKMVPSGSDSDNEDGGSDGSDDDEEEVDAEAHDGDDGRYEIDDLDMDAEMDESDGDDGIDSDDGEDASDDDDDDDDDDDEDDDDEEEDEIVAPVVKKGRSVVAAPQPAHGKGKHHK
jgi:ribosome biogenesis protein SSF1/2